MKLALTLLILAGIALAGCATDKSYRRAAYPNVAATHPR